MTAARGEAPGKVILLGEHSAVYGYPALAIPVHGRKAVATVAPAPDGKMTLCAEGIGECWRSGANHSSRLGPLADTAAAALRLFRASETGVRVNLSSTIPVGCGMGSSAAVSVALVRAIAAALGRSVSSDELSRLVMISERGFHGNPSGIDAAVIARDEPVLFTKGRGVMPVRPAGAAFRFLIANSGIPSSTASVVGDVARDREANRERYEAIFREMGDLAVAGKGALESGGVAALGNLMNRAHELLREIGVSTAKLDAMADGALRAGAAGAKLSGAGRGGNAIALLQSQADESAVREAFQEAGAVDICVERLEPAVSEATR
jgi:mevalonate kinase